MTRLRDRKGVLLAATLLGVALTANLGAWQLRRAAQKTALQAALDSRGQLPELGADELVSDPAVAPAEHFRRVRLKGRWLADRTVFLENRQMDGRVGFYVVTPLLLQARPGAVIVQRGFVPRSLLDRTALPRVETPTDVVEVRGRISPPPGRLLEFAPSASGAIRQNIDLRGFAAETGLRLLPMSIQQTEPSPAGANDGLARRWPRPAVDVQMHYGYAFQWFALCALMAGLYVWFQLIRPRLGRPA